MATFSGQDYTNFRAINLRGSTVMRLQAGANTGTMFVGHLDGSYAWRLPNKSGGIPVMGSFAIQLPLISATTGVQRTAVTVSGIRFEDALVVSMNKGVSAGYTMAAADGSTARIFSWAEAQNGSIDISFANLGVSTGYVELVGSYVALR